MSTSETALVRRAAMDLLARREHSFNELCYKLGSRFPSDLVSGVLEVLREEGLQSDDRYVEGYVRGRQSRGMGPMRIRSELQQKGVSSELIQQHLIEDDEYWLELGSELLMRKFGSLRFNDYKEKSKRYRFLAQKGFTSSQINQMLR